jgi:polysaccharide biosynthesis protein PslL
MDRKYWIDIAKGIGILCVVAGHALTGSFRDAIFVFHMPLFFFLSGLLFYPRSDRLGFLGRKTVQLLVPYFAFLALLFIPRFYHGALALSAHPDILIDTVSTMLWGGNNLKGTAGVFWFVTCLFLTQQIVNAILSAKLRRFAILCFAALMTIGFINSIWLPHWQWPWAANVVCMAAPIVYLGYLLRDHAPDWKIASVAILFGIAALTATLFGAPLDMDMKHADYGIPFFSLAAALCIGVAIIQVSRWAERFIAIRKSFGLLGQMSMTVMYLHLPVLVLMQDYLHIENEMALILFAVALPMIAHWVFERFSWTRAIFLGSFPDFSEKFIRKQNRQVL